MSTSTTAAEPAGPVILGYRRADGRFGLRNHLLVLSTVALTNRIAQLATAGLPDAVVVAGDFQRGLRGRDAALQERVLRQLLAHPNVGAAVAFVHDAAARARLESWAAACGRPLRVIAFMEGGGVQRTVAIGAEAVREARRSLDAAERVPGGLGELTVALECGGSDASSAVCANPVIGGFVDRVVRAGGRAIVSETAEFIGAEHVVAGRAASPEAARDILDAIAGCERLMREDGDDYRGVNPTAENLAAGLTTLVEKSMGAVAKCGSARFEGKLDFAQTPPGPGLWFMDTPFFSPVSITGMVSAGAQLTLFGIGVFNPSGVPLAPTLKVCGNPATVRQWVDAIDVDVSAIVEGRMPLADGVDALHARVAAVSAGELTWTERWGEGQVIVPRETAAI